MQCLGQRQHICAKGLVFLFLLQLQSRLSQTADAIISLRNAAARHALMPLQAARLLGLMPKVILVRAMK